jgi:hypothetical protein
MPRNNEGQKMLYNLHFVSHWPGFDFTTLSDSNTTPLTAAVITLIGAV